VIPGWDPRVSTPPVVIVGAARDRRMPAGLTVCDRAGQVRLVNRAVARGDAA
jgi:hypothetical protein